MENCRFKLIACLTQDLESELDRTIVITVIPHNLAAEFPKSTPSNASKHVSRVYCLGLILYTKLFGEVQTQLCTSTRPRR